MTGKEMISKLADVPLLRSGFDALDMTAPVLVQMNPDGKWENTKPNSLDEERLKAVVQHLMKSNALSTAQSYCCQCAAENPALGTTSKNYVPVIMMPLQEADHCPFDMNCEIQKMKDAEKEKPKKGATAIQITDSDKSEDNKKKKKRGFVMQRLTDFDLLSQW